jgi:nicotinamide riboside kinase
VNGRRYGLTLLTADDIPWEDDGTRDRPEERSWFQRRFQEELSASGREYVLVEGPPERRLATATAAITKHLIARGCHVVILSERSEESQW